MIDDADVTRPREIASYDPGETGATFVVSAIALNPREIVPASLDASTPIVHKDYVGNDGARGFALRRVLAALLEDGHGQIDLSKVETILVHRVAWGGAGAHKVMAHLWVRRVCAVCGADTHKQGGLCQDGENGPDWYCADHWLSHAKSAKKPPAS